MGIIGVPMGYVLRWLMSISGNNFALAVFLFTILVNLVMLPLTIKTQKTSMKQARLRPKLEAIKKKYGDDRMKVQQATQELYTKEGVSPAGGCLPMVLRLVFMMGVYEVIRKPISYIANLKVSDKALKALGGNAKSEITLLKHIDKAGKYFSASEIEKIEKIDFNWLGIQLTERPHFSWDIIGGWEKIWLIPLLAFAAAMINSIVMLIINKKINPDQPNMAGMMLTMPLISLFFAFSLEGAVGFYWICSSLISCVVQALVTIRYNPNRLMAEDRLKAITARDIYEKKKISEEK